MARTKAQLLAQEQANIVADETMKNINGVRKMAQISVIIVMAISYLHQAMYLWELMGAGLNDMHGISGAIGAVFIPIAFDLFALICIRVGTTTGLKQSARRWALAFLVVPTAMSGYVNVRSSVLMESGWIIATIYVMVVALIPLVEFIRSRTHCIDYSAIHAIERNTLAAGNLEDLEESSAAAPALPTDPMTALLVSVGGDIEAAQKVVGYKNMSPSDKQSWSRRANAALKRWRTEMADPVQSVRATKLPAPADPARD